jgi:putative transposase
MTTAISTANHRSLLTSPSKAHRIRGNPTSDQVRYRRRACGTHRFVYNWGLAEWQRQHQAYKEEQATLPKEQRTLKPPIAAIAKRTIAGVIV